MIVWAFAAGLRQGDCSSRSGVARVSPFQRLTADFPKVRPAASEVFAKATEFVGRRIPGATLDSFDARTIPFRREFDAIGAFERRRRASSHTVARRPDSAAELRVGAIVNHVLGPIVAFERG